MPTPDLLWAFALASCGGVIAWCVQQIILARESAQQLRDHIEECGKRQIYIMEQLARIGAKLNIEPPTQPR